MEKLKGIAKTIIDVHSIIESNYEYTLEIIEEEDASCCYILRRGIVSVFCEYIEPESFREFKDCATFIIKFYEKVIRLTFDEYFSFLHSLQDSEDIYESDSEDLIESSSDDSDDDDSIVTDESDYSDSSLTLETPVASANSDDD